MINEATISKLPMDIEKKPLPNGWKWVKLGEVCYQDKKIIEPNSTIAKNLPYLSLEHIKSETGEILKDTNEPLSDLGKSTTFAFDIRHILYSKLRPYLNKVALPDFTGRCTTELIPLLPTEKTTREFVAWVLRRKEVVEQVMQNKTGSRMPRADMGSLLAMKIPLPPLHEQKRIAAILAEQLAAVDQARKAAQEQLEAAKALPAAYLREVFESEEAKGWKKVKFENIAILQRGYDLPSQDQVAGKYPIVTSSGINGTHYQYKEKAPGIITGRSGSIGKVHYCEQDYWPHNTALFIKDFMGNYPRYVYYLLQSIDLKEVCSGSGVPTLDRKAVHRLIVKHPHLEKQKEISAYLDIKFQYGELLKAHLEDQIQVINKLPSALLQRAFSGEL